MNTPYQDQNNELINLINILSFVVGIENMRENRIQSTQNDMQVANDRQSEYLLREINHRFGELSKTIDRQDRMFAKLSEMVERMCYHE